MDQSVPDALQRTLGAGTRVERELGGGGMSRVFLATDVSLDRQVVIKVLTAEMAAGVSAERFRREIQLVAKLQHPHIVSILSAGDAEGALYYVMPFMSGESLRARLAREGKLPIRDVMLVLREMLDALSFAHAHGVVHRDIKPENILSGAGHSIVADFGVSKALQDSGSQTTAGIALGTPAYMAPEQIAADPGTDERADLYAAAVVAYEMLAGAAPFSGTPGQLLKAHLSETPRPIGEVRADTPPELASLIMRALEKDPDARPRNAAEMIAVLDGMQTSGATQVKRAAPDTRRLPRAVVPAAVAVALVAAGGLWAANRPQVMESAQSIAVAPFAVADGDTALVRLGQNLVTTISANIDGVGDIHTADPMAMLSQAKLAGPMLTQAAAVKLARDVGARSVLYGTLTRERGLVRAIATLRDVVDTSRVIASLDFGLSSDSISALTDSLTWKLLRDIWQKGKAPTPNATSLFTRSPKALRDFLDGEQLFARGGITEATDAYQRAIAEDTTFWFAHYRYKIARDWMGFALDTTITHRLARHLGELPARERAFILARDSFPTMNVRLQNLKAVIDRYPDYTPALLGYADLLSHHAMRSGHEASEAIAPWRRLTELLPSDMEAASHLAWACLAASDMDCATRSAQRLDSLVRVDSALTIAVLQNGMLAFALHQRTASTIDSLDRASQRDSIGRHVPGQLLRMMNAVIAQDSRFLRDNDVLRDRFNARLSGVARDQARIDQWFGNAIRGSTAAVDSALASSATVPPPALWAGMRQSLLRMRVLSELQGLLPADSSIATLALAAANAPGVSEVEAQDYRWMAAANALVRGDSAAYKARLAELSKIPGLRSQIAARSLRGIALGRNGNTKAAAESLLAIERFHGDSGRLVWGAFGADRLLAADWLTEQTRYASADSLLRFTDGYTITQLGDVAASVHAAAALQRSRIAEAEGKTADAIRYASIVVGTVDRPSPAVKPLVDEARERLRRLKPGEGAKRQ